MQLLVRCVLASVLAAAAAAKLARPRASEEALETFGLGPGGLRRGVFVALVASELLLAAGVALGLDLAAFAASAFLLAGAALLGAAILRGRSGAPCACFGARSSVSWLAVARNVALAAAFAVVPFLPGASFSGETWLAVGLVVALVSVAALTIAVLALARELGELRLRLGPQQALEIPEEGPPVGDHVNLVERFRFAPQARFALAVFSSESCALCQSLAPAVAAFNLDPLVTVEVFDEARDAGEWRRLAIPGSPFAVVLDRDGIVRSKGTFNSFGQLESLLAAAERRSVEVRA